MCKQRCFGMNRQHSLCVSADIWSLGVILFMLVCGQPPFQEANDSETLTMIMDCKYTVPPHISHACREWVTRTRTCPTQMDGVLCRCCIFHVCRCVKKRDIRERSGRCPAFTRCCSQLLHRRCSAALSVSNAPFKIGPLFLTLWGFNDASRQSKEK